MKITAISNKAENLGEIRRILDGNVHGAIVTYLERSGEKLEPGKADIDRPDVLILDSAWQNRADIEAIEALTQSNPQLSVLLLCPSRSPETLISAMRAGVREVLPSPVTKKDLLDAINHASKRISVVKTEKPRGKILAFLSCKGGSGATFLATNLGYALATEHGKKVLLIDLDLQYGDASFFMSDSKSSATVAEVARQIDRLDGTFLTASSIEIAPDYLLLPAPEDAERAVGIMPEHIDHLLNVAVENFDFVILDLERSIDAVSMRALDRADTIFPVMQPMVPYIRDTQKLLRVFKMLGYPDSKVRLISNRTGKDLDIPVKKMEKTLGVGFYRMVPNDFESASTSVNQGVPILRLVPGSPVSHALKEFAADLAGAAKEHASWLGKIFRSA
jgi:pilus assembly protein CpaE